MSSRLLGSSITFRLYPQDKEKIERAAQRVGLSLSDFARLAIKGEAVRQLSRAKESHNDKP